MSEPTNQDRADWAEEALRVFMDRVGSDPIEEEPEQAVGDFLADLMHFCRLNDISFDSCLDNGRMYFREEVLEEEDWESCDCCGGEHPVGFEGDCRDNDNRRP